MISGINTIKGTNYAGQKTLLKVAFVSSLNPGKITKCEAETWTGTRGKCESAIVLQKVSHFNEDVAEQTGDEFLTGKSWWPRYHNKVSLFSLSFTYTELTSLNYNFTSKHRLKRM